MLKYINAINILADAKIDSLKSIYNDFSGDWERAWNSNLSKYIPQIKNSNNLWVNVDWKKIKQTIDPDKEIEKLKKLRVDILLISDKSYPARLRHIAHPPFMLYVRGSKEILKSHCLAVVGTRRITDYGKRATSDIVSELSKGGLTIVSGFAYGVDSEAHKTTLRTGGKTIAVFGSGIDDQSIFPQANVSIAHKILEEGGALISEYGLGKKALKITFPQRNRIISGISMGVLVVEGDIKSGTMITAKSAIDQNRDVFAIPGSIYSFTSRGTNWLIKNGAKLVTCGNDILEEYDMLSKVKKEKIVPKNEEERKILEVLMQSASSVDEIIRKTEIETNIATSTLMIMEIDKKIKNLGNNKFAINN